MPPITSARRCTRLLRVDHTHGAVSIALPTTLYHRACISISATSPLPLPMSPLPLPPLQKVGASDPAGQVRMVRAQMSRAACYTLLSHAARHTRE